MLRGLDTGQEKHSSHRALSLGDRDVFESLRGKKNVCQSVLGAPLTQALISSGEGQVSTAHSRQALGNVLMKDQGVNY